MAGRRVESCSVSLTRQPSSQTGPLLEPSSIQLGPVHMAMGPWSHSGLSMQQSSICHDLPAILVWTRRWVRPAGSGHILALA